MTPEKAVERYLKERRPNISSSTYYNHSSLLKQFTRWCDREGLEDITDLDGWHLYDFKSYRREEDGINEVTLRNQFSVLRIFIQWCESMGLADNGLAENMIMPDPDNDVRDDKISTETAETILDYLAQFEYATLRHAMFVLLWDIGCRIGTLRAIDLADYHPDEHYVEIHHRPETETPLKNGEDAEREVNLHRWVCEIIDDYIEMHRHNVTDDYDREPLLTTEHGRPVNSNIRGHINSLTRPCHYTNACPHDRGLDDCEATKRVYAQRCPSSVSPHAIRRSAITHWLNEGKDKHLLSDRMDVGVDTLDEHYDGRTKSEKRQLRREKFDMD